MRTNFDDFCFSVEIIHSWSNAERISTYYILSRYLGTLDERVELIEVFVAY